MYLLNEISLKWKLIRFDTPLHDIIIVIKWCLNFLYSVSLSSFLSSFMKTIGQSWRHDGIIITYLKCLQSLRFILSLYLRLTWVWLNLVLFKRWLPNNYVSSTCFRTISPSFSFILSWNQLNLFSLVPVVALRVISWRWVIIHLALFTFHYLSSFLLTWV